MIEFGIQMMFGHDLDVMQEQQMVGTFGFLNQQTFLYIANILNITFSPDFHVREVIVSYSATDSASSPNFN